MYIQVTRVSDITSADGKYLRMECLKGKQFHPFSSSMKWPRQGNPPKMWWNLWSKTLRQVFTADGSNTRLRCPLGAWTESLNIAEWRTMCAVSEGELEVFVRREHGQYDRYQSASHGAGRLSYVRGQPCGIVDTIPKQSVPADMGPLRRDGRRPVQLRSRESHTVEQQIDQCTTFEEFVQQQEPHIQTTMEYSDIW